MLWDGCWGSSVSPLPNRLLLSREERVPILWVLGYRAEWLQQDLSFAGLLWSLKPRLKSGSPRHQLPRQYKAC